MSQLLTVRGAIRALLPSTTITSAALIKLRAEVEANRVIRGMYVNSQGAGCLMYWLIGAASRTDRYNILETDPNHGAVTRASETLISFWDAAAREANEIKARMNQLILREIDRELVRRRRLNQLEDRARRQAIRTAAVSCPLGL